MRKKLDLSINLTSITFESDRHVCLFCNNETERIFRERANEKGIVSVYYSNKNGPSIAISYKRKCKKCEIIFHQGYYKTKDGDQVFETLSQNKPYHLTDSTFFDPELFHELDMWQLTDGVGFSSYTEKYNLRFKKEIDDISEQLNDLEQTIGKRNTISSALIANRLKDAYWIYCAQKSVEYTERQFIITNAMFQEAQTMQQMKIEIKVLQKS